MTRKALLIAILAVTMGAHMTGCSSSGSKDDTSVAESNDETFAEEGEGDFADTSKTPDAGAPADATADAGKPATDAKPEDGGSDLSLDANAPADGSVAANGDAGGMPADAPPADAANGNLNAPPPADAAGGVATNDAAKPADDLSLDDPGALPADTASTTPPPAENITQNPAAPSDAGVFDTNKPADTTVADAGTPPPADTTPVEPAPVEAPVSDAKPAKKHSSSSSGGSVAYAPLMKVKDSSFTGPGGATLNRVYIARPKDTAKSIAQKVYNDPKRSKDLVKWNPVLKRGARAGDKVYYASAANPSDSKMMNYYEEAGVQPQTYVSKDGDNLRTVAKSLLGYNDAWKEVWETNPTVESKGKIPSGLTISYWPDSAQAAPVQTMAANTNPTDTGAGGMPTQLPDAAPQVPPSQPTAGQPQAMNQPPAGAVPPQGNDPFAAPPPGAGAPPPAGAAGTAGAPGMPVADNGQGPDPMAPPPPNDAAAQAAGAGAPPPAGAAAGTTGAPPAPPQAAATPPAPEKPAKKAKPAAAAAADDGGMDPDTTMALGVGGVLLVAAAILFVVIRKNRAKRMDLGQTQV